MCSLLFYFILQLFDLRFIYFIVFGILKRLIDLTLLKESSIKQAHTNVSMELIEISHCMRTELYYFLEYAEVGLS